MNLNLGDKQDYSVKTKNTEIGKVKDFLFDDKKWTIRYMSIDPLFGGVEQSLLIPVKKIKRKDWVGSQFFLACDLEKIKLAPVPTSVYDRTYESRLLKHFKIRKYWERSYVTSMSKPTRYAPKKVLAIDTEYTSRIPFKSVKRNDAQTKLKSLNELKGFEIYMNKEKVATLSDLIFDSKTWRIKALVVRIGNDIKNVAQEIIIPTSKVNCANYVERKFVLSHKVEELSEFTQFNESAYVNEISVVKKFDFTGKPLTKYA